MRALAALLILCAAAPLAAQPQPAPQAEVPRADPQPLVLEAVIDSQHAGRQHVVFVLPPTTTARPPATPPSSRSRAWASPSAATARAPGAGSRSMASSLPCPRSPADS